MRFYDYKLYVFFPQMKERCFIERERERELKVVVRFTFENLQLIIKLYLLCYVNNKKHKIFFYPEINKILHFVN